MVEEEKLEVPQKYFDLLPDPIKYTKNNNTLTQLRNSLLWLFYLYDLPKEKRDEIIRELLKTDYITKLNLYPGFDPLGIFLYFRTGYENIISSIKRVLRRINQYKITHPGLIVTSLYSVWIQPSVINENEYKLLVEIIRNPSGSLREWSKNTKISLAGVKYAFDRLKKKLLLRIWSQINFNAIKLKHYIVRISEIHNETIEKEIGEIFLKNIWCRSVFSFASEPYSLFISLTVPSHVRCTHRFLENIKLFEDIGSVEVYEVREVFTSYNFTAFNPKTGWHFSPSSWTSFFLSRTLEDYLDYLRQVNSIHRISYNEIPNLKFSRGDLYIIAGLSRDFRLKPTILSKISGYSLPAVSKKKKDFVKKGIIRPFPYIVNIGLSSSAAILWRGAHKILECLMHASSELPYTIGYRIKKIYPTAGDYLLTFTWLPGTVSWDLIQNFSEIGKEYGLEEFFYERKGPGSFTIDRFIYRWNEEKQVWQWSEKDFNFLF